MSFRLGVAVLYDDFLDFKGFDLASIQSLSSCFSSPILDSSSVRVSLTPKIGSELPEL